METGLEWVGRDCSGPRLCMRQSQDYLIDWFHPLPNRTPSLHSTEQVPGASMPVALRVAANPWLSS